MAEDLKDLLCASLEARLNVARYRTLVERFGSWDAATKASPEALRNAIGVGEEVAARIRNSARSDAPEREMAAADQAGVRLVPHSAEDYPAAIKRTDDAPLVLYVKGTLLKSDPLALAVVGSRRCTYYGRSQAERMAFGLANAGFCIVSGLAEGIDAAAHRGALKAGKRTIAVLGCGLGRIYPVGHEELADQVVASGALLSEQPMDAHPDRRYFPRRNRLIAALGLGVLVVEAAARSGALITARLAAEMGKDVFAIPGNIDRFESRGCHRLIKDGAKLVESLDDIIEELGPLAEAVVLPAGGKVEDARVLYLNEREQRLFNLLSSTPMSIDEVIIESGLPASQVGSTLMVLELKRLVKQLAGKRFVRA